MSATLPPGRPVRAAVLGLILLTWVASLSAATGGFLATLSTDQQGAVGLSSLSAAERSSLDQLVAAELAQVRLGPLDELTGSFSGRHSPAELKTAGLEHLTTAQRNRLDEMVAAALAFHPKPKERPRLKEDDVINPDAKPEIHGSVSLTVGTGGRGGNFWGSSLWLDYFDPASGLSLSVGLSNYSGKGLYGYYPDYPGNGYYYDSPILYDLSYRGPFRGDFLPGTGQSFRAAPWNESPGYLRRRH